MNRIAIQLFCLIMILFAYENKSYAGRETGVNNAGESDADGSCGGKGKVAQWCPQIMAVINDPTSCGGEAVAQLTGKNLAGMEEICPEYASMANKKLAFAAITSALITVES